MDISEHQEANSVLEYYVSGVGILIVSLVGVSGNIVSGVILRKRQRDTTKTFSDLLVWLAGIDTVFLVLVFLLFSLPHFCSHYSSWLLSYIAPVVLPCSFIAMTGSVYTVLALAIERYLTLSGHTQGNKGAFLGYLLPVIVFSTFLNSPKFLEFSTKFLETESGVYPYLEQTSFRLDPNYAVVLASNILFLGLLPFSLLLIFNILILRLVRSSSSFKYSRCQKTGSLLVISLVTIQIFSHLPRTVLNIYEVYQAYQDNTVMPSLLLVDMSHLLLVISSSINVFIFTVQDQMFRADLLTVLSLPRNHDDVDDDDDDDDDDVTEEAVMVEKSSVDAQDNIPDNHNIIIAY